MLQVALLSILIMLATWHACHQFATSQNSLLSMSVNVLGVNLVSAFNDQS